MEGQMGGSPKAFQQLLAGETSLLVVVPNRNNVIFMAATLSHLCDDIIDCESTVVVENLRPKSHAPSSLQNPTRPDVPRGRQRALSRSVENEDPHSCATVDVHFSVRVCVLVSKQEHKGHVLELKPCRKRRLTVAWKYSPSSTRWPTYSSSNTCYSRIIPL